MLKVKDYEFWFVTGSQTLYGPEVINQVKENQCFIFILNLIEKFLEIL